MAILKPRKHFECCFMRYGDEDEKDRAQINAI